MPDASVASEHDMTKQKMTIFGDSWVYGTWKSINLGDQAAVVDQQYAAQLAARANSSDPNQTVRLGDALFYNTNQLAPRFELVHDQPGLSAILSNHFEVEVRHGYLDNTASAWTILRMLKEYVAACVDLDQRAIMMFQPDFNTDLEGHVFDVNYDQMIKNTASMDDFFHAAADSFYQSLDSIAQDKQIKIYLCGGTSDLDLALIDKYQNLIAVCDSWIKLMLNDHVPSVWPTLAVSKGSISHLQKYIDRYHRDDLDHQLSVKHDPWILNTISMSGKFMPRMSQFPGVWPNLESHTLMANYIINFFQTQAKQQ